MSGNTRSDLGGSLRPVTRLGRSKLWYVENMSHGSWTGARNFTESMGFHDSSGSRSRPRSQSCQRSHSGMNSRMDAGTLPFGGLRFAIASRVATLSSTITAGFLPPPTVPPPHGGSMATPHPLLLYAYVLF